MIMASSSQMERDLTLNTTAECVVWSSRTNQRRFNMSKKVIYISRRGVETKIKASLMPVLLNNVRGKTLEESVS